MHDINLAQYATYTALVIPIVQYLKELLGLRGFILKIMPLLVGAAIATLCLQADATQLFPMLPPIVAALVLGVLLGVAATGSYQTVTWLQDRNAQAHATAQAQVQVEQSTSAVLVPVVTDDAALPTVAAQPAPSEYVPATDTDLQGQPHALLSAPAASSLPATMVVLPDADAGLDMRFPPVPMG